MMFVRSLALALKELRQLRRDKLTLAMTIALPLMQLMLFGYAINTDVRHINTVIYDQDRTAPSRDLYQSMVATGSFDVVGHVQSYAEIERSFRLGESRVALVVPRGFARSLGRRVGRRWLGSFGDWQRNQHCRRSCSRAFRQFAPGERTGQR
jgi:ABC-2 type transport system permease protein